jgi:hypothetical protein
MAMAFVPIRVGINRSAGTLLPVSWLLEQKKKWGGIPRSALRTCSRQVFHDVLQVALPAASLGPQVH